MNWFGGFLKNRRETTLQLLLIAGIAITANILAGEILLRFDLTANNRYTLSEASREIAGELEDPVTVTAYFSDNLPPQLAQTREQFRNFLEEFRAFSGDNVEYEFRNPNESAETERQAQQAGIRPVSVNVRERDQVSQQRVYLGAVFHYGGQREAVPVIRPGAAMEYTIASTVRQLTMEEKPVVGLLQGHGEPTQQEMRQLTQQLSQQYTIREVSGLDSTLVPPEVEVLMVVAPQQPVPPSETVAIDQYLMSGGKALFALNRVRANTRMGIGMPLQTGLEPLLSAYNLPVNADLVRDVNAARVQVQQRQAGFSVTNAVQYPYIPLISNFSDHPISGGLESVLFRFVSTLDTASVDSSQSLTVLAESSNRSDVARGRFNLNPSQEWSRSDFSRSRLPVAGVIEGRFRSAFAGVDTVDVALDRSRETAMVVVGDGDFVINGRGQAQPQRVPEDNISFFVNAVNWLADDTGLIALRTKGVTSRPLAPISPGLKTFLKYLNLLLPLLLVIGYGFYRYRVRRTRRREWMASGV